MQNYGLALIEKSCFRPFFSMGVFDTDLPSAPWRKSSAATMIENFGA
jgi:hypothetical protein